MNSSYSDGAFYLVNKTVNPFIVQNTEKLSPGLVIDFGCGNGKNLYYLLKKGWEVYAIDRELLAVQLAQKLLPSDRVVHASLSTFDFDSTPNYDLILCNYVLQHVPPIEVYDFVKKFSNKAKLDSHLLLSFFEHREGLDFDSLCQSILENGWTLCTAKKWSRLDTAHDLPHMHHGVESFWIKNQ